jgi:uncharacterized membrane protein
MTDATSRPAAAPKRIPRSCSDVYRLWAALGLGLLVTLVLEILVDAVSTLGLHTELTDAQRAVQEDFGANLIAWCGFALAYLWLGARAFFGCDREELVRRVLGSPLPRSRIKRWILAGGGGIGWPVLIAIWAFSTVITALVNRANAPAQTLVFAAFTVLSCVAVITFSFALLYARKDIERGGLDFPGPEEATFSDYLYLATGCSVTFGTTDTLIMSTSMRRTVSMHSVLAWTLNTVVIAVLLSVIVSA